MVFQEVICKECGEEINVDLDNHTLISTYKGDHVIDESYFHFYCFVKWYNRKVSEKAKNSVKTMQDKIQGLMNNPKIAGLLSMVGGVDKLKGMLNTNLDQDAGGLDINEMMESFMPKETELKESIKKVNDDDGKKRKPRAKPKPTKKKVQ